MRVLLALRVRIVGREINYVRPLQPILDDAKLRERVVEFVDVERKSVRRKTVQSLSLLASKTFKTSRTKGLSIMSCLGKLSS